MSEHALAPTLAAFRAAVSENVVALDVHAPSGEPFEATVSSTRFGDKHLLTLEAPPHQVTRTASLIERDPREMLKITLVQKGSLLAAQAGREVVAQAGHLVTYLTDEPYALRALASVKLTTLLIPVRALGLNGVALDAARAQAFCSERGLAHLVAGCLAALANTAEDLGTAAGSRATGATSELVAELLHDAAPVGSAALTRRDAFAVANAVIDERLGDSEFSPSALAAQLYLSPRALQQLFADHGTSVARLIREKRLSRCYDVIARGGQGTSIQGVAKANGFLDVAHFSRMFKARFGVTPSSLMGQALVAG